MTVEDAHQRRILGESTRCGRKGRVNCGERPRPRRPRTAVDGAAALTTRGNQRGGSAEKNSACSASNSRARSAYDSSGSLVISCGSTGRMLLRVDDRSLSRDRYRAGMAPGLHVRLVRPEEYERAGAVTALAYQEFARPDRPGWVDYHRHIGDVAGRARRAAVLVALLDGVLVGSATIELDHHIEADWAEPLDPDEAHLRMLGVHPDHRRRGIGRALVEASIDLARHRGRRRLTLETTEVMRAAQRMYESMGFTFLGTREFQPGLIFLDYELSLPQPRRA
ncbi:MAG: GNAT family N-acetyltransferase, partial [Candidatus Dormibacteraeota bacterium]|nr:GNAT family N-acetyltransferase [Candidatus Dormibacteraeota bacterium]